MAGSKDSSRASGFKVTGPRPVKQAREEILAAHSKEPKTYIALQNGIDHKDGFINEGRKFTTTQPQGSWMEEVDDAEEKPKAKGKKADD